jgi:flavorubredoxin
VEILKEKLNEKGVKVALFDLARDDMAEAIEDSFKYGKLVLATTTYNGSIFPFMNTFIETLVEHNYQNRTIGFIENGTWAPVATKIMKGKLENLKNITFTENTVKILSSVKEENIAEIEALANELA